MSCANCKDWVQQVKVCNRNHSLLQLANLQYYHCKILSQDSSSVNNFNCSSQTLVRAIDNTECVSEPYTGDVCLQLLATTWSCSVGARSSVLVNASDRRQTLETNLTTFLNILSEFIPTCPILLFSIIPRS